MIVTRPDEFPPAMTSCVSLGWKQHLLATAVKASPATERRQVPCASKTWTQRGFDMLPTVNTSRDGCHCAMKVDSHRPVMLSCTTRFAGLIVGNFPESEECAKCTFSSRSSRLAMVVQTTVLPEGDTKALLTDLVAW
jgi:hypothetical protein